MRLWTAYGKEHIYNISSFRVHIGEIKIDTNDLQSIHNLIQSDGPCCISFLSCTTNNEVGQYLEHTYRGCTLARDNTIRFMASCIPSPK